MLGEVATNVNLIAPSLGFRIVVQVYRGKEVGSALRPRTTLARQDQGRQDEPANPLGSLRPRNWFEESFIQTPLLLLTLMIAVMGQQKTRLPVWVWQITLMSSQCPGHLLTAEWEITQQRCYWKRKKAGIDKSNPATNPLSEAQIHYSSVYFPSCQVDSSQAVS